jgi:hypothetical protein
MTTQTRRATVTAYYLGRPAALWRAALAPHPTIHESPDGSFASTGRRSAPK